jgi:hypothetical protein
MWVCMYSCLNVCAGPSWVCMYVIISKAVCVWVEPSATTDRPKLRLFCVGGHSQMLQFLCLNFETPRKRGQLRSVGRCRRLNLNANSFSTKIQTRVTSRVASWPTLRPINFWDSQSETNADCYNQSSGFRKKPVKHCCQIAQDSTIKGPPRVLNVILRWRTFLKQS